jgi:hypothetical protein
MANKKRMYYADRVALRSCKVACRDLSGIDKMLDQR